MNYSSQKREFRIRPLSEGIGLGTLHSASQSMNNATERGRSHDVTIQSSNQSSNSSTFAMRRAQAIYKPNSVEAEIRRRGSTRLFVALMRFIVGTGADLLVGSFTVIVLSWAGILAWNAGSTGNLNPLAAVLAITDALESISPVKVIVAVVTLAIVWRTSRTFLMPQRSA